MMRKKKVISEVEKLGEGVSEFLLCLLLPPLLCVRLT